MLDFSPSEVSFYEQDAKTFIVLDKEDEERKVSLDSEWLPQNTFWLFSIQQLYYTNDFGESFSLLQTNVKSFVWSAGDGIPIHLYVERKEPSSEFNLTKFSEQLLTLSLSSSFPSCRQLNNYIHECGFAG